MAIFIIFLMLDFCFNLVIFIKRQLNVLSWVPNGSSIWFSPQLKNNERNNNKKRE